MIYHLYLRPHTVLISAALPHTLAQLIQYCSLHLSRQLDRNHIALECWNEFLYLSSKQIHSPWNPSFFATLHIRSLPFITAYKFCVVWSLWSLNSNTSSSISLLLWDQQLRGFPPLHGETFFCNLGSRVWTTSVGKILSLWSDGNFWLTFVWQK